LKDPDAGMESPPEPEASSHRSIGARATVGAVWIFVENASVQGLAFAVFAVIARYVTASDVGLMSLTFILTQGARALLFAGVTNAITRKQSPTATEFTTGFWIMQVNAIVATVLIIALAPALQGAFAAPGLQSVIDIMSLTVLMYGISSMQEAWLLRHFHFRTLALRSIAASLTGALVGIALAVKGFGVMALVNQQLTAMVVNATLLWVACPWRPSFRFSRSVAREICFFWFGLFPHRFITVAYQNCDTILVGMLFGPASVGVYNVAKRARLALQLAVAGPMNGVALPTFAKLQGDPEQFRKGVLAALALVSAFCAPIFLGIAATARDVVLVLFGPKWIAAAPVLAVLVFGGFASVLVSVNENVFIAKGRPAICSLMAVLYAALAVPLFIIFREWPSLPFALPFVLPYCIVVPVFVWLCQRYANIPVPAWVRATSPGVVAGIVMFLAVRLLRAALPVLPLVVRLPIACSSGAVVYAGALYVLDRRTWLMMYEFMCRFLRKLRRAPGLQSA
jgi:O-antigen/teichoic acid export membrane protein